MYNKAREIIDERKYKEKPLDDKKKNQIMNIFCPYCGELLIKNKSTCTGCKATIKFRIDTVY